MKFSMTGISFNLNPVVLNATDSDAKKPEDVTVNLNSEGASFNIDNMEMEVSISEIVSLCGNKATTPVAAPTTPEQPNNGINEIADMGRAIIRKLNELKEASTPTPSAPASPKAPKKPKAPKASKVAEINDDDEFI